MAVVGTLNQSTARSPLQRPSSEALSAPKIAAESVTTKPHQQDSLSVASKPSLTSAKDAVQELIGFHQSAIEQCDKSIASAKAKGLKAPWMGGGLLVGSIGASIGAGFIPVVGWAAAVVGVSLGLSYFSYRAIRSFVCRHGQVAMATKQKEFHETMLEELRSETVDTKTKLQKVHQMEQERAESERCAADTELARAERSSTASTATMVAMAAAYIASSIVPGVAAIVTSVLGSCALVGGYLAGGFAKGASDDQAAHLAEERLANDAAAMAASGLRAPAPATTIADAISGVSKDIRTK